MNSAASLYWLNLFSSSPVWITHAKGPLENLPGIVMEMISTQTASEITLSETTASSVVVMPKSDKTTLASRVWTWGEEHAVESLASGAAGFVVSSSLKAGIAMLGVSSVVAIPLAMVAGFVGGGVAAVVKEGIKTRGTAREAHWVRKAFFKNGLTRMGFGLLGFEASAAGDLHQFVANNPLIQSFWAASKEVVGDKLAPLSVELVSIAGFIGSEANNLVELSKPIAQSFRAAACEMGGSVAKSLKKTLGFFINDAGADDSVPAVEQTFALPEVNPIQAVPLDADRFAIAAADYNNKLNPYFQHLAEKASAGTATVKELTSLANETINVAAKTHDWAKVDKLVHAAKEAINAKDPDFLANHHNKVAALFAKNEIFVEAHAHHGAVLPTARSMALPEAPARFPTEIPQDVLPETTPANIPPTQTSGSDPYASWVAPAMDEFKEAVKTPNLSLIASAEDKLNKTIDILRIKDLEGLEQVRSCMIEGTEGALVSLSEFQTKCGKAYTGMYNTLKVIAEERICKAEPAISTDGCVDREDFKYGQIESAQALWTDMWASAGAKLSILRDLRLKISPAPS